MFRFVEACSIQYSFIEHFESHGMNRSLNLDSDNKQTLKKTKQNKSASRLLKYSPKYIKIKFINTNKKEL